MGNEINRFTTAARDVFGDGVLRKTELNRLKEEAKSTKGDADDKLVAALELKFKDGTQLSTADLKEFAFELGDVKFKCLDEKAIFKKTGDPCVFDRQKTAEACTKTAATYPGIHLSQPALDVGSLFGLFNASGAPDVHGGGNAYEKMVSTPKGYSCIDRLRENLAKCDKANLGPEDVLKLALDASGGDYTQAALAAHNLLKYVAYTGRENLSHLNNDELALVNKLGNLRPTGSKNEADKMGPWYHFFGVLAMGALTGREATRLAMNAEHLSREEGSVKIRQAMNAVAAFVKGENSPVASSSPKDTDKAAVDEAAFDIVRSIDKENSSVAFNLLADFAEGATEGASKGATAAIWIGCETMKEANWAGEWWANKLDQAGVFEALVPAVNAVDNAATFVGEKAIEGDKALGGVFSTAYHYWFGK